MTSPSSIEFFHVSQTKTKRRTMRANCEDLFNTTRVCFENLESTSKIEIRLKTKKLTGSK